MSALSDSIVTRLVGYDLEPGSSGAVTPNLPIAIAILAPANSNMQVSLEVTKPTVITSVVQAAAIGGYGSPIYQIAKILFPNPSGIPVYVFPQLEAVGASAKKIEISVTGTATKNGTHFIKLAGRKTVAGQAYAINVISGDDAATIHDKIADCVNNVLGAPMSGVSTDYLATLTSKWKDLTADELNVEIDLNGNALGLSYTVDNDAQSASGTPSVQLALNQFKNVWYTHVINAYGLNETVMDTLEAFNGKPAIGENPPSGRYLPTVFKPFLAYSGSVLEDPSSITDSRLNEVTIKVSPAPLSKGLSMEAAANDCLLAALCAQNTPEKDVIGASYPDMPTPENIGLMSAWEERDRIVKKGCSTVDLIGGVYVIEDPVTTYHPIGENPVQFRFARILVIDWNTRFTYLILEDQNVLNKVIAKDTDVVGSNIEVIKPKIWKAVLAQMALDMVARGLWVDAPFAIANTTVNLSTINPDRLNTNFSYKRSGVVRQSDTTATASFNLGTLTAN